MASATTDNTGGSFFTSIKKSFADVPVNPSQENAIETSAFLEASESLTTLFDVLGSVAFKPVKADILGNVKKVRDRQLAAPKESETLQSLLEDESKLKPKERTASEGLLWLVRALDFTAQALRQNVSNPSDELSTSFRGAYTNTLKPHHSFIVKPIFAAAMSATPYRKDFYAKLGGEEKERQQALDKWLTALEQQVSVLKQDLGRRNIK